MANMIGSARQLTPVKLMGGPLQDSPDCAGGYADNMSAPKVNVPTGGSAKSMMLDGPFGGKVKA